jgi:hypothetical protein
MLDHRFRTRFVELNTESDSAVHVVSGWLRSQGKAAHVLVMLPGRTPGEVKRLLDRIHPTPAPDDGVAATLVSSGVATVVRRYELAEGRRYALLGVVE